MNLARRRFLQLATGASLLLARARSAGADGYPSRPVRIVLGFEAGGAPDVVARLLAQWLSARAGQNFIIDNRPGAGGNIATDLVVRAAADGYTLLVVGSPNFINATLHPGANFSLARDIAPVASIGRNPFVMVVNPSFPAKTIAEFIAYAKANPGKVNMTSTGTGNLTHFSGELFKMLAGVDMLHVPARGEMQAQSDLLAGRADVLFDPIVSSIGYIKAGKLRALGVTAAVRIDMLPDVAAVGEFVPGYLVDAWLGIAAPKETPADVIDYLNKEIGEALADPDIKARLAGLGFLPVTMSAAQFGKFTAGEIEKWAKVVDYTGIKPE
jgi:tripartite-type tricarboxylate transporter receptor subunit TctC